jgi:hypothetical protein
VLKKRGDIFVFYHHGQFGSLCAPFPPQLDDRHHRAPAVSFNQFNLCTNSLKVFSREGPLALRLSGCPCLGNARREASQVSIPANGCRAQICLAARSFLPRVVPVDFSKLFAQFDFVAAITSKDLHLDVSNREGQVCRQKSLSRRTIAS